MPESSFRSRPLDRERAWLREHAREYPGCWLALYEDRLIAADPDLEVVLSLANQTPEGQRALTIQATCFVSAEWSGPRVVGWKGCLERTRFGFDTTTEAFSFAEG